MENKPFQELPKTEQTPTQAIVGLSENIRRNLATGVLLTLGAVLAVDVTFPQTVHMVQDFLRGDALRFTWDATTAGVSGVLAHAFIAGTAGKEPYRRLRDEAAKPFGVVEKTTQ